MQHERDAALAFVAGLAPCAAVALDVLGNFRDRLSEKMGEHVHAERARPLERRRRARRGQPDRQLGLHRTRQRTHLDRFPVVARERDGLASPQPLHGLDVARQILLRVRERRGIQHEVIWLPTGCKRDRDPPSRQVVDHRPFFGDADRGVQRKHHAAGTNADVLGDRRERRARDARVRVRTAEGVEVSLRCPHRFEAIAVGEAGALEQEPVAVGGGVLARSEVEEAEGDRSR